LDDFNITINYSDISWDYEKLGFESKDEFMLYRFFNNKGNPNYSGFELNIDCLDYQEV